MAVNKWFVICFLFFNTLFSQKREDVYFKLEQCNIEYVVKGNLEKLKNHIILYNRKDYEYHQSKVTEAKDNNEYFFDSESGEDNLSIPVEKLIFEILSKEKMSLINFNTENLNIVDYNWLQANSWKKIANQSHRFNNIFFFYTKNNESVIYKVDVAIIAH